MVFIDAENISKELFYNFYQKHPEEHYRVYGKLGHFSDIYLRCKYIDFIHCCSTKNSADTFMTADIVKSIYENDIYTYYIMTHDKDLAIAIKMLTEKQKHVILVSCVDGEMKNLQEVGVDFTYLDYEQYTQGVRHFRLISIPPTPETKIKYDNCPNKVWIKLSKHKILEVPFRHGIPIDTLRRFLAPYHDALGVGSVRSWADVLTDSYIKIDDGKAWFYTEEELYVL